MIPCVKKRARDREEQLAVAALDEIDRFFAEPGVGLIEMKTIEDAA